MNVLLFILPVILFIAIIAMVGYLFKRAGYQYFQHFPKWMKITFYILWLLLVIMLIALRVGHSEVDERKKIFLYYYPILSYLIMILYFPLNAMLLRFFRWVTPGETENSSRPFVKGLAFLAAGLSILACFFLFIYVLFFELFKDTAIKVGG